MTIVEELKRSVHDALVKADYNRLDAGPPNNATQVTDRAIAKFFEDYEEVEVRSGSANADLWRSCPGLCDPVLRVLRPKPRPEMRTVSRKTLAVLAEHYEGTPEKDTAGNAALAEVKAAL